MSYIRLQQGVVFDDAIAYINSNFDAAAGDVADFNPLVDTTDLNGFIGLINGSGGTFTVDSGVTLEVITYFYSTAAADQVGSAQAYYTIAVDPVDQLNIQQSEIWPDGSLVTGGKRAFVFNGYPSLTGAGFAINGQDNVFVAGPLAGKTLYAVGIDIRLLRNLDSVTHRYFVGADYKITKAPGQSTFR